MLEALERFRDREDVVFGPPGHRQGAGADPRVLDVVGAGVFASDVLMLNGLDDRRLSQGVLEQAQELMADAVGAEKTFFSTCGRSLSVKTAMMSVAGPGQKLLVSRNAHKSVVAGLVLTGIEPVWVHPHHDERLDLVHPPGPTWSSRACTRWARPSSRARCSTCRATWATRWCSSSGRTSWGPRARRRWSTSRWTAGAGRWSSRATVCSTPPCAAPSRRARPSAGSTASP